MTSEWRLYSRRIIAEAIASVPDGDVYKIKKAIDKAYPFGRRENHPYKMWLVERRQALIKLGIISDLNIPKNKNGGNLDSVPPCQLSLFDL